MSVMVYAVTQPSLPPFKMSDRFRTEIAYFMSIPGQSGVPQLPEGEYWVRLAEARQWQEEGVISLVSPLDSQNQTEVELREEQEDWLAWMLDNNVEHIRIL
jgi:hypothetical protein